VEKVVDVAGLCRDAREKAIIACPATADQASQRVRHANLAANINSCPQDGCLLASVSLRPVPTISPRNDNRWPVIDFDREETECA